MVLKKHEAELPGAVKLFFQPAEEAGGGAKPMIEAGCMKAPEVKRVIAVFNDNIAYEATLGDALKTLFGREIGELAFVGEIDADPAEVEAAENGEVPEGEAAEGGTAVAGSQDELIQKANEAFNNAVSAQQNGDWAAYGDYLKELQHYLEALEAGTGE